ncbi:hypothetical protein GUI43_05517 [Micromonospora noduli]|nr:hypothetical protein GUI43_05517 [Micromonospora noduli]RAO48890.1 hypothetical protein ONO86_02647 [Micromonospora noduli]
MPKIPAATNSRPISPTAPTRYVMSSRLSPSVQDFEAAGLAPSSAASGTAVDVDGV